MDRGKQAEFAFDVQTSLGRTDVPEFDALRHVGMCAVLAVHLRGLGEIEFGVMRLVSDYYFNIPSYVLRSVLEELESLDLVSLVRSGGDIVKVIPQVPHFQDVYAVLGQAFERRALNEHEHATLSMLDALQTQPRNVDSLFHLLQMPPELGRRCTSIGLNGGLLRAHRARGRNILVSPLYFADNLNVLADLAAGRKGDDVAKLLAAIRANQGWPLGMAIAQQEIGGTRLPPVQIELAQFLAAEGVIRPPTIESPAGVQQFLFTPRPGEARLNGANREVYERAMALVSAVRKGQLLPEETRIRSPLAILRALRQRGHIGSNTDAQVQYRALAVMRVGKLVQGSWGHEFHLIDLPENATALDKAIELLESGQMAGLEVDKEARIALGKDEQYVQSLIAAKQLRTRGTPVLSEEAKDQVDQLVLSWGE